LGGNADKIRHAGRAFHLLHVVHKERAVNHGRKAQPGRKLEKHESSQCRMAPSASATCFNTGYHPSNLPIFCVDALTICIKVVFGRVLAGDISGRELIRPAAASQGVQARP
jgi:hypothetical protein